MKIPKSTQKPRFYVALSLKEAYSSWGSLLEAQASIARFDEKDPFRSKIKGVVENGPLGPRFVFIARFPVNEHDEWLDLGSDKPILQSEVVTMCRLELRPCPFCGGAAGFERCGDRRQSCIVACSECGARHESGDTCERSGSSWNTRPGWKPIAELPEKPEGDILLANGRDVMGLYSGVRRDKHGTTWFIDDAFYDGDEDPEFFLVLPPLPS